jgi:hypothetical protein
MTREQKMYAILQVLARHTLPKDQFGFVTQEQVCDEILKAIGE